MGGPRPTLWVNQPDSVIPFTRSPASENWCLHLENVITCLKVSKRLGGKSIITDADFTAAAGQVTALLGPSGCGKSTLLKLITGLLEPDSGTVRITDSGGQGRRPAEFKQVMGLVMQDNALFDELTLRENAGFFASLYGISGKVLFDRFNELIERLDLGGCEDKIVADLSGGQKRRGNVLAALIHSPRIILMDEPTAGLDPATREFIWGLIGSLRQEGLCIVFTTHYLDEVEKASDSITIMDGGKIAAQGDLAALKAGLGVNRTIKVWFEPGKPRVISLLLKELSQLPAVNHSDYRDGLLTVNTTKESGVKSFVLDLLKENRESVTNISVDDPDLEDVFFLVTGRKGLEIAEHRDYG
jgi:ABC-2 type transport system ATP-binding protein